jgi:hypothetical protein
MSGPLLLWFDPFLPPTLGRFPLTLRATSITSSMLRSWPDNVIFLASVGLIG